MSIRCWQDILKEEAQDISTFLIPSVEEICLLSAEKKDFIDETQKKEFCHTWVTQYLLLFPEFCFVFMDEEAVLGYIVACPDTHKYCEKLNQSGLSIWPEVFPEGYEQYPAHLHINLHPKARGKGAGTKLLAALEEFCAEKGISGIHLITVQGARNVQFYNKNGYEQKAQKVLNQTTLVFLGKKLSNV